MTHIIINGPRGVVRIYYIITNGCTRTIATHTNKHTYYTYYYYMRTSKTELSLYICCRGDVVWPVICYSRSHVSRPINHNILLGAYYARPERFYNDFLYAPRHTHHTFIYHQNCIYICIKYVPIYICKYINIQAHDVVL